MREKVRPDEPLSRRISRAQRELDIRIRELDVTSSKFQKMQDKIFHKVMMAQRNNQISFARMYAQELAQVRKMRSMVNHAKLSLERVNIRLGTVTEFGDIVVTLSPCMSLIKGLAPSISGIMPRASSSMSDLSQMLGDVMSGATMGAVDTEAGLGASNSEALAILEEAHNVMVGEAQSALPDVPMEISTPKPVDAGSVAAGAHAYGAQPQQTKLNTMTQMPSSSFSQQRQQQPQAPLQLSQPPSPPQPSQQMPPAPPQSQKRPVTSTPMVLAEET